jgi:hypothetical protein
MVDDGLFHLAVGQFEVQRLVVCRRSDFEEDYVAGFLVWLLAAVVCSELL